MVELHRGTKVKPGNNSPIFESLPRLFPGLFPGFALAVNELQWTPLDAKRLQVIDFTKKKTVYWIAINGLGRCGGGAGGI